MVIDNNNLINVAIIYDVEDGGLCHHHPHSRNNYCINDVDCQGCQRDAAKLNRARSDGELGFVFTTSSNNTKILLLVLHSDHIHLYAPVHWTMDIYCTLYSHIIHIH